MSKKKAVIHGVRGPHHLQTVFQETSHPVERWRDPGRMEGRGVVHGSSWRK